MRHARVTICPRMWGTRLAVAAGGTLLALGCSSSMAVVEAEAASEGRQAPAAVVVAQSQVDGGEATASPVLAYLEDPEAVAFGGRYFRAVCSGYCHSTRAGLVRDAPDLFDCDWRHGAGDEDVYRVITEGVPDTEMLPFGQKLDAEVLWKIIAYLRAGSRCSPD